MTDLNTPAPTPVPPTLTPRPRFNWRKISTWGAACACGCLFMGLIIGIVIALLVLAFRLGLNVTMPSIGWAGTPTAPAAATPLPNGGGNTSGTPIPPATGAVSNTVSVEVLPFEDWPHQNGRNETESVTAPSDGWVLVQYGFEARVNNAEVPGGGIALVAPGQTVTLTIWDGNAEVLRGSAEAVKAYAASELAARKANEGRIKVWQVIGLPTTP